MKNKNKIAKLEKAYIKFPQRGLTIGLSPMGIALLLKLIDLPEEFNPTYAFLEKQLNISRPSLVRQFKVLRDCQIINLLKKGSGNSPSVYEFNPPSYWLSLKSDDPRRVSDDTRSSVLRNRLMQKGKLGSRKDLAKAREGCPEGRHIDFIIPIVHKDVCGLNVPWNIQYLTWDELTEKASSFDGTNDNISWRNIKSVT